MITETFQNHAIPLADCRAQGYDNAASMYSSIPEAITYLGSTQTTYTLFSCIHERWKILAKQIGCSLHGISGTRWSNRAECEKTICSSLSRRQVVFGRPARAESHSKNQEQDPWRELYVMSVPSPAS